MMQNLPTVSIVCLNGNSASLDFVYFVICNHCNLSPFAHSIVYDSFCYLIATFDSLVITLVIFGNIIQFMLLVMGEDLLYSLLLCKYIAM